MGVETSLGALAEVGGYKGLIRELKALRQRVNTVSTQQVPIWALLRALFATPGGTVRITTPEQYGAVGNGIADDWLAIMSAVAVGGLVMFDPNKVYAVSQPVIIPPGVFLVDGRTGRSLIGTTGAKIQALNSFSGGSFVVEFLAGVSAVGGGLSINVGGLGNISSALGGVLIPDGCYNSAVEHAWIGNLSDSAIRMTGQPVAARIRDVVAGFDVTARTLTVPTGVLELSGSDTEVDDSVELFGGPSHAGGSSAGYDRVSYPGQFFRVGLLLSGICHNMKIGGVVAEFCDVGWYVAATGNHNRIIGGRSDYSAGHGIYITGAADFIWMGVEVNGASFATAYDGNYYDGTLLTGGAQRHRFIGYEYNNGGAPNAVRYGWNDATTGNGTQQENTLTDYIIKPEDCFYDTVNRAEPRTALVRGGSGPVTDRPPSRWANGQHWWDATRSVDTVSDGSAWRDSAGGLSGNLVTPKLAEGIGGTLQIQNADSSCTVTGGLWVNLGGTPAQLLPFGAIAGITCTAAGATAGFMTAATVADTLGHFTAITAGQDYTYAVRTVANTIAATTIKLVVNYFDSGNSYLGSSALTTATGGGTNSTTAVTDTYWQHVTAPAGAAFAQPVFRFTRTGMAAGEAHFLNGVTIIADTAGVVTGYVRP